MVQILAVIPGALFNILAGLFGTVARIYDIMLTLTGYYKEGGVPDNLIITTSNVMTTMYTLAGVFMLFRVTVSMINLLIEPDKINDSQAGPQKILVRVLTSIAMLLIFVPNGWIFSRVPDNPGILMRIEKALLAQDGLINNLMPEVNGDKAGLEGLNKSEIFTDNVYAVTDGPGVSNAPDGYDCYYVHVVHSSDAIAQKNDDNGITPHSDVSITNVIHLTFYDDKTTGTSGKICPGSYKLLDCNYSYTSDTGSGYSQSFKGNVTWSKVKDGLPTSKECPKRIDNNTFYDDYKSGKTWKDGGSAYVGGWTSLDDMKKDIQESGIVASSTDATAVSQLLGISAENSFLFGVSEEAVDFAQSALSAFIDCNGDEDCEALKSEMLLSNDGNKAVADALNDDNSTMQLDFIIGVVAGIGLVVWIAVLCVEVIIRRFKLILLEMIAPIPIIAYIDPKDESFTKWGKMYVSTFLDLFFKLIAIAFAIALLKQVRYAIDGSGLLMFFYIIAILLFAKMIPDMISKIFGIDVSSGSFKDIIGMGKKVLGAGAGAIGGAGVALAAGALAAKATGADRMDRKKLKDLKQKAQSGDLEAQEKLAKYRKGRQDRALASGMTGASTIASFFKGAVAGSQGKLSSVIDTTKEAASIQTNRKAKYVSGLAPADLIAAGTAGKIGLDYASRVDREVAPLVERKEIADEVPKLLDTPLAAYKKSGFAQTLDAKLRNGEITGSQHKELTKEYLDWQSTLLGESYGEVDKDGKLTGRIDIEKVSKAIETGAITEERAKEIIMNDMKFQAAVHGAITNPEDAKAYSNKLHAALHGELYETYGEVDKDGKLTGKLDMDKVMKAVEDGIITEDKANEFVAEDIAIQRAVAGRSDLDPDLAGDVKVEIGIQNTLSTAFNTANARAQGSSYFADAIGNPTTPIVDFNGLDAAINAAYGKSKDLSADINAKTVGDAQYVASKAANQAAGNDKK